MGTTFNLTVANATGCGFVDIAMVAADFGAADTIHVNASAVGNTGGKYDIAAGSPTKGFATWDVHSTNAGAGLTNNLGAPTVPLLPELRCSATTAATPHCLLPRLAAVVRVEPTSR